MTHEQMIYSTWFDEDQLIASGVQYAGDRMSNGKRADGGYGMNILRSFDSDPDERASAARTLAHLRLGSRKCPVCGEYWQ